MYRGVLVGVLMAACSSSSEPADPPPCVPFDITVQPVSSIGHPIWTGSEYLILTQGSPGVIQRIGADGSLGPTISLGVNIPDTSWPIAWTGDQLGVVSFVATNSTLELTRFGLDGTRVGTSTIATSIPDLLVYQSLRWVGDRYVAAWAVSGPDVATIEEVSAKGAVGTKNTVAGHGNLIFALAATPTTYLAILTARLGSNQGSYVTIDRATGVLARHDVSIGLASQTVLARDPDFIAYNGSVVQPDNTRAAAFQTIDASGMETTSVPAPVLEVPDMVLLSDRYHLVDSTSDASGYSIRDVEVGFDGTPLGPLDVRATFPQTGSFVGAYVTARGNGVLTSWATGPNGAMTARLIQDCVP